MYHRICFVCPGAYACFDREMGLGDVGGAERQVYLLSTALSDQFDVHVVVGDYGQAEVEFSEGVTIHRAYPLQSRRNVLQPVRHLLLLARVMRRADADIYVHRGEPRNAAFVYLVARILGRKWVYNLANDANIIRRPNRLAAPIRRLYTHALKNAEQVISQTERQQELLREVYGVESVVVPNGYPRSSESCSYEDREYLLWVGHLDGEQKRPHLLLDIADRLSEVEFRVVGPLEPSDPYHRLLISRTTDLSNVELVGAIHPDEIHDHYRRAIALVSTSAYEGFPNIFLEAWRQGTPVLSLDVDPKRFLDLEPLDGGYSEGSLETLVEQCQMLVETPAIWRELAEASRERFEAELRIEKTSAAYGEVLANLLD